MPKQRASTRAKKALNGNGNVAANGQRLKVDMPDEVRDRILSMEKHREGVRLGIANLTIEIIRAEQQRINLVNDMQKDDEVIRTAVTETLTQLGHDASTGKWNLVTDPAARTAHVERVG